MEIFVGVKKSDLNFVSTKLAEKVNYIIWPDNAKEKSKAIFSKTRKTISPNSCYVHFSGYQKLSDDELNMFGNRCVNLHPAPPKYPGVGGINFALYLGDKEFGVTVHLMNEKIDNGKILDVITFPLEDFKCLDEALYDLGQRRLSILERVTKEIAFGGFRQFCKKYDKKRFSWSKNIYVRKKLDTMQILSVNDINFKSDLERRIQAFHTLSFPLQIKVGNRIFSLREILDDEN